MWPVQTIMWLSCDQYLTIMWLSCDCNHMQPNILHWMIFADKHSSKHHSTLSKCKWDWVSYWDKQQELCCWEQPHPSAYQSRADFSWAKGRYREKEYFTYGTVHITLNSSYRLDFYIFLVRSFRLQALMGQSLLLCLWKAVPLVDHWETFMAKTILSVTVTGTTKISSVVSPMVTMLCWRLAAIHEMSCLYLQT